MDKKGQGISLGFIVAAAIAVLVLVIVVLFVSGSLPRLFGEAETISGITDADVVAATAKCSNYCVSGNEDMYCDLQTVGTETVANCEDPKIGANCPGVSCP